MFKNLLNSAVDAAKSTNDTFEGLLETHWPTIESKVGPVLVEIAESHLNEEAHMRSLLESAHAMLPLPVRLVIRQNTFIEYFQGHQEHLLRLSQSYKEKQALSLLAPNSADSRSSSQ